MAALALEEGIAEPFAHCSDKMAQPSLLGDGRACTYDERKAPPGTVPTRRVGQFQTIRQKTNRVLSLPNSFVGAWGILALHTIVHCT